MIPAASSLLSTPPFPTLQLATDGCFVACSSPYEAALWIAPHPSHHTPQPGVLLRPPNPSRPLTALALSPCGPSMERCVFAASRDAVLRWSAAEAMRAAAFGDPPPPPAFFEPFPPGLASAPSYIAAHPMGSHVAVCFRGPVLVYDSWSGRNTYRLDGHEGMVTAAAFFPSSPHLLATAGEDRSLRIWDLDKGTLLFRSAILCAAPLSCLAADPDYIRLAVGASDGSIRFLDLTSPESYHRVLHTLDLHKSLASAAAAALPSATTASVADLNAAAAAAASGPRVISDPSTALRTLSLAEEGPGGGAGTVILRPKWDLSTLGAEATLQGWSARTGRGGGGASAAPPGVAELSDDPPPSLTERLSVLCPISMAYCRPPTGPKQGLWAPGAQLLVLTAATLVVVEAKTWDVEVVQGVEGAGVGGRGWVSAGPDGSAVVATVASFGGAEVRVTTLDPADGPGVVRPSQATLNPSLELRPGPAVPLARVPSAASPSGAGAGAARLPGRPPAGPAAPAAAASVAPRRSPSSVPDNATPAPGVALGGPPAESAPLSVFQRGPLAVGSPLAAPAETSAPGPPSRSSSVPRGAAAGGSAAARAAPAHPPPRRTSSQHGPTLPADKPVTFHSRIKSSGYGMVQGPMKLGKAPPPPQKVNTSLFSKGNSNAQALARPYPMDSAAPSAFQPANLLQGGRSISHTGPLLGLAYSPDGTRLLTWGANRTARAWRLPVSRLQGEGSDFIGHDAAVTSATWAHSGQLAATSSMDRTARIWAVGRAEPLMILDRQKRSAKASDPAPPASQAPNPSFTSDVVSPRFLYLDQFLALGHQSKVHVYRLSVAEGEDSESDIERLRRRSRYKEVAEVKTAAQAVTCVAAANSIMSTLVLCGGSNRSIEMIDLSGPSGRVIRTIPEAHDRPPHSLVLFEPPATTSHPLEAHEVFGTAAQDGSIRLWDLRDSSGRCTMRLQGGHTCRQNPIGFAFSPCLRYIGTGSEDRTFALYDIRTGICAARVREGSPGEAISSIAFCPTGPQVAAGCLDGTVRFYGAAK